MPQLSGGRLTAAAGMAVLAILWSVGFYGDSGIVAKVVAAALFLMCLGLFIADPDD